MTHEAKVNLGELFNQKIKQQSIKPTKPKKIQIENGKKKYGQSGIIGVSKVDSPNYSQGYFFVLKYRNEKNRYQFIQKKSLKELYEYAQSKDWISSLMTKRKPGHSSTRTLKLMTNINSCFTISSCMKPII